MIFQGVLLLCLGAALVSCAPVGKNESPGVQNVKVVEESGTKRQSWWGYRWPPFWSPVQGQGGAQPILIPVPVIIVTPGGKINTKDNQQLNPKSPTDSTTTPIVIIGGSAPPAGRTGRTNTGSPTENAMRALPAILNQILQGGAGQAANFAPNNRIWPSQAQGQKFLKASQHKKKHNKMN